MMAALSSKGSFLPMKMLLMLWCHGAVASKKKETVLRWASCGGGWRAMFTDAGFANALHRAGVSFDNSPADDEGSTAALPTITGLSSTSGGTWFSTQFFYSEAFHEAVLTENADELYDFVLLWMDSYRNLTETILRADSTLCSLEGRPEEEGDLATGSGEGNDESDAAPFPPGGPKQWCIIIRHYRGDWAAFVANMLQHAAQAYEPQAAAAAATVLPSFPDRVAGSGEKNPALRNTDLIVQTSLAPMARGWADEGGSSLLDVYLGIGGREDNDIGQASYFSTMLPTAYTVSGTTGMAQFHFGNWTADEMVAYAAAPGEGNNGTTFSLDYYAGYYLFQGPDESSSNVDPGRSIFTADVPSAVGGTTPTATGAFVAPFSSTASSSPPKTGQIAAMSSAALGSMSGLNPSEMAQYGSTKLYGIQTDPSLSVAETKKQRALLERELDWLYGAEGLWGVSVCSQWPKPCGAGDSRFSDGAYTDNPAFPMNVGQWQRDHPDSDLASTVLKFVAINPNGVTPTSNLTTYNDAIYLGYFNTTFNVGIDPGDFVWAPGQPVPWPSPQIFEEFLDADAFHAKFEPVGGTNWTTAVLTGTTVNNPVYGVFAGQSVEILYFMLNSLIPSRLVGTEDIAEYSVPLAEMTKDLATNENLQGKIQSFFFVDDEEEDGTGSASSSPTVEDQENLGDPAVTIDKDDGEDGSESELESAGMSLSFAYAWLGALLLACDLSHL